MGWIGKTFGDAFKEADKLNRQSRRDSERIIRKSQNESKRIIEKSQRESGRIMKDAYALSWLKKVKSGRSISQTVKLTVVKRDKFRCKICHKKVKPSEAEFDHKKPFSKGGKGTAKNIQLLCRHCNRMKSDN